MRKAGRFSSVILAVALCGCERSEEQAVRHVVTAELMQRYQVQQDQVRLTEVRLNGSESVVRAEVQELGRSGATRTFVCKVERRAAPASPQTRWIVTTVEAGPGAAAIPQ
ncbi:MAG: hypothetical protein IT162_23350 [Bryobacterales bacterium]|nr:hypothetical protein [Bryobacterales bacterium]